MIWMPWWAMQAHFTLPGLIGRLNRHATICGNIKVLGLAVMTVKGEANGLRDQVQSFES